MNKQHSSGCFQCISNGVTSPDEKILSSTTQKQPFSYNCWPLARENHYAGRGSLNIAVTADVNISDTDADLRDNTSAPSQPCKCYWSPAALSTVDTR